MASITTNYSGFKNSYGSLSVDHAEKVFSKDLDRAKRDKSLVSYRIENKEGKKTFEARFREGRNYWSFTETLDYNDNSTYRRIP